MDGDCTEGFASVLSRKKISKQLAVTFIAKPCVSEHRHREHSPLRTIRRRSPRATSCAPVDVVDVH